MAGRAARQQMQNAVRAARDDPSLSAEDLAAAHGVSVRSARRVLSGEYDSRLDATASTVSVEPAANPGGERVLFGKRRPRKARATLAEPEQGRVDNLYGLVCILTAVVTSPLDPRWQLTETDRQALLAPATRMYLRRNSMPDVSPDMRDMITLLVGAYGYGAHAIGRRYVGRDTGTAGAGAGPGSNARDAFHAAFGSGPDAVPPEPAPVPAGGAGTPNGTAGIVNPYDPQFIMDSLEVQLRAEKAQRDAEELARNAGADEVRG